MILVIDKLIR